MHLTVALSTPAESTSFEGIRAVSVPTPLGEISILPGHVPLVTAIAPGELRLRRGESVESFAIAGGVLQVTEGSRVLVLADVAERAEEISEAAAAEAVRRAAELRSRMAADDAAFASVAASLEREVARLRIARKFRHRGHQGVSRGSTRT